MLAYVFDQCRSRGDIRGNIDRLTLVKAETMVLDVVEGIAIVTW